MNETDPNELRKWLKHCEKVLEGRSIDEIAELAIMVGFNAPMVYDVLSHWVTDKETHTTYKIREDWFVKRELDYLHEFKFMWHDLAKYERGLTWLD